MTLSPEADAAFIITINYRYITITVWAVLASHSNAVFEKLGLSRLWKWTGASVLSDVNSLHALSHSPFILSAFQSMTTTALFARKQPRRDRSPKGELQAVPLFRLTTRSIPQTKITTFRQRTAKNTDVKQSGSQWKHVPGFSCKWKEIVKKFFCCQ